MPHVAKALVLHCMDFRFITALRAHLQALDLENHYDLVAAAGAAKNLVDPKEQRDAEFLFWHIEIAQRLHGITEVLLINHRDCGAYGKVFHTPEQETARHLNDLRAARALMTKQFPTLAVRLFLATLERPDRVTIETIE